MAERNHQKIADRVEATDDDPFAELTRIMGFDPRQPAPARPQQPAPPVVSAEELPSYDPSFHIDLEKELMGEFGEDDEPQQMDAVQSWTAAEREPQPALAVEDLDLAFDDTFEDEEPRPVATAPAWTYPNSEPAQADDLELAFDDVFEDAQPIAAAPAWTPPQPPEAEDFDLSLEDALDSTAFEEDVADAVEARAEDISELDDFELEIEDKAQEPLDFWMREPQPVADTAPLAAPAELRAIDEDFTASFDAALADVDMDFESHNALAENTALVGEELPEAETELLAGEDLYPAEETSYDHRYSPPVEPVAYEAADFDAEDLEFDDETEVELEPEPVHYADEDDALFAEPVAVSAEAVIADSATPAASDFDLEQELNALLGNPSPKAAYAPAPRDDFRALTPVVAAPAAAQPVDLADTMDWELDSEDLLADDAEQPVFADEAAEPEALADSGYLDETLDDEDAELPEFDLEAFDAAIAQEFESEDLGDLSLDDEPPVENVAPARQDPLDAITALAAQYAAPTVTSYSRANNVAAPPFASPTRIEKVAEDDIGDIDFEFSPAAFDEMPDIETVDVSDQAVALADDLDIPEFIFEEEVTPVAAYDDLDTEFASLISEMNEPAKTRSAAGYDNHVSAAPAFVAGAAAGYAGARATANHPAYDDDLAATRYELPYELDDGRAGQADFAVDDLDFDPELEDEISVPNGAVARDRAPRQRRGMMLAAIVGGVAIVGGIGAFGLSFGNNTGSEAPVIVKADQGPIKVKPESPGGTTVPNQDSKVYDTVAGAGSAAEPQQKKLVTTAEEPVDVAPPIPEARSVEAAPPVDAAEAAVTPKGEDRIEQVIDEVVDKKDSEIAAVAPRKVRTMVVKPDGTLVPREDPTPAVAAAPAEETVASVDQEPAADMATGSTSPIEPATAASPADVPAVSDAPVAAKPEETAPAAVEAPIKPAGKAQSSTTPNTVPIAPQRPAEQPINVVGEVKPDQVAAISPSPTATAATGGSWSMQIASQPSEAAAQSSYQDLSRRYGSVLNGRQANIVKAEIAGKGTFWRVRVPAQSRNDAVALCESYKAAGGNCFVSR